MTYAISASSTQNNQYLNCISVNFQVPTSKITLDFPTQESNTANLRAMKAID
jgi:hypothetical protein